MPSGMPIRTKTVKRALSRTKMSLKAIMKDLRRMARKGEIVDVETIIRPLK